jgi:S1-C subfamily serine protease
MRHKFVETLAGAGKFGKPTNNGRNNFMVRFLTLILLAGLMTGCGVFSPLNSGGGDPTKTAQDATAVPPTAVPPTAVPIPTTTELVEMLRPSVVLVRADFPASAYYNQGSGSGTGVVISKDGYIVTNAHVVQGASAITVAMAGGVDERPARLVGISPCDDLAVLVVDDTSGLKAAHLAEAETVATGENVLALGYPLGDVTGLDLNATGGIISKPHATLAGYSGLIQHDASLNPGNSGGPLVNQHGEVIGINTLGLDESAARGTYFAISIHYAYGIINKLQGGQNLKWLGMTLYQEELKDGTGVLVVDAVEDASPAAHIGIAGGDVLFKLKNSRVYSQKDVCKILGSQANGDLLGIEVFRFESDALTGFAGEIALSDPKGGSQLAPAELIATQ